MKRKLSKKTQAAVALGAAAVVAVGGTFAWFSTTDQVENVFDMDDFDVSITEAFDPETPMNPGSTITKQVGVTNYGDVPVYVRVKFEESLTLNNYVFKDETSNRLLVYAASPDESSNFEYQNGAAYTLISGTPMKAVYNPKVIEEAVLEEQGWRNEGSGQGVPASIMIYSRTIQTNDGNAVTQYLAFDTSEEHKNQIVDISVTKNENGDITAYNPRYAFHILESTETKNAVHAMKGEQNATADNYIHQLDQDIDTYIELIFADGWEDEWTLDTAPTNNEGYYYYNHVLGAGATTTKNLLDGVKFAQEMPNEYLDATYTITPIMEAVQANEEAVNATWDRVNGNTYEGEHGENPYEYHYNVDVSEPTDPNATVTWTINNDNPQTV